MADYKFYEVKSSQRVAWLNKLFDIIGDLSPELGCVNNEKAMSGCFNVQEWKGIKFTDAKSIFGRMEDGYQENFRTLKRLTINVSTLLQRFPDLYKLGEPEYEDFYFNPNERINYRCELEYLDKNEKVLDRKTYELFFNELSCAINNDDTEEEKVQ